VLYKALSIYSNGQMRSNTSREEKAPGPHATGGKLLCELLCKRPQGPQSSKQLNGAFDEPSHAYGHDEHDPLKSRVLHWMTSF